MAGKKRIAICGFNLESNRFSPTCSRWDFEQSCYMTGAEITRQARLEHPSIHSGVCGFYAVMDETQGRDGWEDAPAILISSTPAGAIEEAFFTEFLEELRSSLAALGPVDGVYICQHGGATAVHTHDPDGDVFQVVRAVVGPDVPVIATLDLHSNISDEMMEAVDMMIGYRTNPHIDQYERGAEAATCMLEMFDGVKPTKFRVRLPLVAPSVTQLTAEGHPYGDLIRLGQTKVDERVMNITVLSGFAFADTPKNGMTVIVHTRDDPAHAKALAIDLAEAGWAEHERYRPSMITLAEAATRAKLVGEDASSPSLVFADPADNPGGGGRGNTTHILRAFHEAGVEGCLLGVFFDPALVRAATKAGEGGSFRAQFNTEEDNQFSEAFEADVTVLGLFDGTFVGEHGMAAGKSVDLGPVATLDLGGIRIVVITKRQQCLSTDFLSAFGLNPAAARSIVVKSRGHFRAGFDYMFPPERIHEVDVPGLTSPNLANFDWSYLPRPVFPLDAEAKWDRSMVG